MKKFLIIVFSLVVLLVVAFVIIDEPLPEGVKGPEAERLADNILAELNKPAWDSLKSISWTFPGLNHHYNWDKVNDEVEVTWDDYKVIFNTDSQSGKAYENGQLLEDDSNELVKDAINYFNNDSFWLIAPYKIKDPGTIRTLVNYEGKDALLVQYTSGGTTPGDSYLWILDENNRPVAWKLWVSIIPIGGMSFSWEEWKDINGAQISTIHDGIMTIEISDLK